MLDSLHNRSSVRFPQHASHSLRRCGLHTAQPGCRAARVKKPALGRVPQGRALLLSQTAARPAVCSTPCTPQHMKTLTRFTDPPARSRAHQPILPHFMHCPVPQSSTYSLIRSPSLPPHPPRPQPAHSTLSFACSYTLPTPCHLPQTITACAPTPSTQAPFLPQRAPQRCTSSGAAKP